MGISVLKVEGGWWDESEDIELSNAKNNYCGMNFKPTRTVPVEDEDEELSSTTFCEKIWKRRKGIVRFYNAMKKTSIAYAHIKTKIFSEEP